MKLKEKYKVVSNLGHGKYSARSITSFDDSEHYASFNGFGKTANIHDYLVSVVDNKINQELKGSGIFECIKTKRLFKLVASS